MYRSEKDKQYHLEYERKRMAERKKMQAEIEIELGYPLKELLLEKKRLYGEIVHREVQIKNRSGIYLIDEQGRVIGCHNPD